MISKCCFYSSCTHRYLLWQPTIYYFSILHLDCWVMLFKKKCFQVLFLISAYIVLFCVCPITYLKKLYLYCLNSADILFNWNQFQASIQKSSGCHNPDELQHSLSLTSFSYHSTSSINGQHQFVNLQFILTLPSLYL